ncbi:MAG: hypothetical protein RTU30_12305, partial [Candidatus Thorarchaeota archaeon]
ILKYISKVVPVTDLFTFSTSYSSTIRILHYESVNRHNIILSLSVSPVVPVSIDDIVLSGLEG